MKKCWYVFLAGASMPIAKFETRAKAIRARRYYIKTTPGVAVSVTNMITGEHYDGTKPMSKAIALKMLNTMISEGLL